MPLYYAKEKKIRHPKINSKIRKYFFLFIYITLLYELIKNF